MRKKRTSEKSTDNATRHSAETHMSNFLCANNVSLPECQTGVLEELERDEIENSGDFLESDSNDGSIQLSIHIFG